MKLLGKGAALIHSLVKLDPCKLPQHRRAAVHTYIIDHSFNSSGLGKTHAAAEVLNRWVRGSTTCHPESLRVSGTGPGPN